SKEFLDAEYALFRAQAKEVDIVITTALIPGRPAPKLWHKDMVELMRPGSVVVDLAAEQGGNCEYTVPGQAVVEKGVTIVGYTDLPSRMASVASDLYGMNLWHFLEEMGGAASYKIDHENDAVRPALVLEAGEKKWPAPPMAKKETPAAAPAPKPAAPAPKPADAPKVAPPKSAHGPAQRPPSAASGVALSVLGLVLAAVWLGLRYGQSDVAASPGTINLLQHLTVFVLAIFVGMQVVWNVTPALHTPLMSVTNAISGIIVVGGLLSGVGKLDTPVIVAVAATLFATINIAGGFIVTRRMLAMFRK
ncbi:MAG TPA: proton-translocating transhydrogenase family protein, partial [Kofleriaceae bacterium]|nr:proton-translocating transhydrogenase family protein [Kofleriaceae bacterium]